MEIAKSWADGRHTQFSCSHARVRLQLYAENERQTRPSSRPNNPPLHRGSYSIHIRGNQLRCNCFALRTARATLKNNTEQNSGSARGMTQRHTAVRTAATQAVPDPDFTVVNGYGCRRACARRKPPQGGRASSAIRGRSVGKTMVVDIGRCLFWFLILILMLPMWFLFFLCSIIDVSALWLESARRRGKTQ